jgi:hypothetical protein
MNRSTDLVTYGSAKYTWLLIGVQTFQSQVYLALPYVTRFVVLFIARCT